MMISPAVYHQELVSLLGDAPPELYIVGRIDPQLQPLLADVSTHCYADISGCLDAAERLQSASILMMICTDSIDTLPHQLGTICQRFPNQVLIELQHNTSDEAAAQVFRQVCFAMGFRQALHCVSDTTEYQLYEYRLKNYKQAPDWLNSRFWAHPERFNTR